MRRSWPVLIATLALVAGGALAARPAAAAAPGAAAAGPGLAAAAGAGLVASGPGTGTGQPGGPTGPDGPLPGPGPRVGSAGTGKQTVVGSTNWAGYVATGKAGQYTSVA